MEATGSGHLWWHITISFSKHVEPIIYLSNIYFLCVKKGRSIQM